MDAKSLNDLPIGLCVMSSMEIFWKTITFDYEKCFIKKMDFSRVNIVTINCVANPKTE